jgi:hypothetical protein
MFERDKGRRRSLSQPRPYTIGKKRHIVGLPFEPTDTREPSPIVGSLVPTRQPLGDVWNWNMARESAEQFLVRCRRRSDARRRVLDKYQQLLA